MLSDESTVCWAAVAAVGGGGWQAAGGRARQRQAWRRGGLVGRLGREEGAGVCAEGGGAGADGRERRGATADAGQMWPLAGYGV